MKKVFCVLFVLLILGSLAAPVFAAEQNPGAVIVPAEDLMLDLFPALFEGITALFQSPPLLYLLGIFILAFIVLIFKLIFHF